MQHGLNGWVRSLNRGEVSARGGQLVHPRTRGILVESSRLACIAGKESARSGPSRQHCIHHPQGLCLRSRNHSLVGCGLTVPWGLCIHACVSSERRGEQGVSPAACPFCSLWLGFVGTAVGMYVWVEYGRCCCSVLGGVGWWCMVVVKGLSCLKASPDEPSWTHQRGKFSIDPCVLYYQPVILSWTEGSLLGGARGVARRVRFWTTPQ